eukprot:2255082-Prymnesium_polylepis.2
MLCGAGGWVGRRWLGRCADDAVWCKWVGGKAKRGEEVFTERRMLAVGLATIAAGRIWQPRKPRDLCASGCVCGRTCGRTRGRT